MTRVFFICACGAIILSAATASAATLTVDGGYLYTFNRAVSIDAPTIAATIDIKPESLQRTSHGEPVMAFIDLPSPFGPHDVEAGSIRMRGGEGSWISPEHVQITGHRLEARFGRSEVIELVSDVIAPDTVVLTVCGVIGTGAGDCPFEGTDTVRIVG
ncbi:MAG: hypothetical protein E4G93_05420 [Dehalococcoidia bacterium]|nr:MAG: hypothetical protein E4G93_05420 [Dehalococcoidia bacterium]